MIATSTCYKTISYSSSDVEYKKGSVMESLEAPEFTWVNVSDMMMERPIVFSSADRFTMLEMSKSKLPIYEDDPAIAMMTDSEIRSEIDAAFGAWADREDIDDNWLFEMRKGWNDRLEKIFGADPEE